MQEVIVFVIPMHVLVNPADFVYALRFTNTKILVIGIGFDEGNRALVALLILLQEFQKKLGHEADVVLVGGDCGNAT